MNKARIFYVISGVKYWWSGWFGSQLASREWRNVPAGTQRDLFIDHGMPWIRITVFQCRKRFFKYDVSWTISLSGDTNSQNKQIRELKEIFKSLV